MLRDFIQIISLRNLRGCSGSASGQIATLLILMMVVVLIFILITANLGQLSITSSNLSNASDSGSLYLASQLATKGKMLYDSIGGTEKCQKRGLLSIILAVVGAIIGLIIGGPGTAMGFWGAVMGGAIGGGTGAAIEGTNVLQGFLQGAIIGAAIGGGAAVGKEVAVGLSSQSASAAALQAAMVSGFGAGTPTSWWMVYAAAFNVAIAPAIAVGTALGVGLSATTRLYNTYISDKMLLDAFNSAAKALNGLPEYDRFRESVFLQVLSQTVADPNTTPDVNDSDGDGDTQEDVPYFQYWWDMRVREYREILEPLSSLTSDFVNGPLNDFRNFAEGQYTKECVPGAYGDPETCTLGAFYRKDIEGEEAEGGSEVLDGVLIELLRGLEDAGYDIDFWQPGPTKEELEAWEDEDCEECAPPEGYDEVDEVISDLEIFAMIVDGFKNEESGEYYLDNLTSTWESWVRIFYNEEDTEDYYDSLEVMSNKLEAWKNKIIAIRDSLPECNGHSYGDYVTNPPCQSYSYGDYFATVDEDLDDEFAQAITAISDLQDKITAFRPTLEKYFDDMKAVYATIDNDWGRVNPVTYAWKTKDSQGNIAEHSVVVEAGPFIIPWVKTTKSWKKACIKLQDYSDDGSSDTGRTWIRVTRKDPANVSVGVIGKWNPYDNNDPLDPDDSDHDGIFSVSKKSRAYFSYDRVGIAGKD